jgi:hypothetical protein
MSISKKSIDLCELEEDISYHADQSNYFYKAFEEARDEAELCLAKFQEHYIARLDLINYLKTEYCGV